YGRESGIKVAYRKIEEILRRNETSFKDFEMTDSVAIDERNLPGYEDDVNEYRAAELTPEQHEQKGQENYAKANEDQKKIIDELLEVIEKNELKANCFFIDGPGGT